MSDRDQCDSPPGMPLVSTPPCATPPDSPGSLPLPAFILTTPSGTTNKRLFCESPPPRSVGTVLPLDDSSPTRSAAVAMPPPAMRGSTPPRATHASKRPALQAEVPPSPMPQRVRHSSFGSQKEAPVSTGRYISEFEQVRVLGHGSFGTVFLCKNRLDDCLYAVKMQTTRDARSNRRAQREVFACATIGALGAQAPNVLRYYSVWREGDSMYIQNEYCDGGAVRVGEPLDEVHLCSLVEQVARGLAFLHGLKLAHMDIKPENIFKCHPAQALGTGARQLLRLNSIVTDDVLVYKIGDFGLLTSTKVEGHVEEGDSRYLAPELLRDDFSRLTAVDIFSLGMTAYELASRNPLPTGGEMYQVLRSGKVPRLASCSDAFNHLVAAMLHPDPQRRPSAEEVAVQARAVRAKLVPVSEAEEDSDADRLRLELYKARYELLQATGSATGTSAAPASAEGNRAPTQQHPPSRPAPLVRRTKSYRL